MLGPLVGIIALLLFLATLIARIHLRWWFVRSFEFPRVQLAIAAFANTVAALVLLDPGAWRAGAGTLSLVTLLIQVVYILPWTRVWPVEVKSACEPEPARVITLLISNVLTPNRQSDKLIAAIKAHQPDIVITLESDDWWQARLDESLGESYFHSVKVPLDNLYGMHLYSRLPLEGTEVKWLIQEDIPSIHTYVTLESGERIRLYAVHPRPPAPSESEKSLWRDAELLWVGQEIHEKPAPTLVAGDLNDVAWSRTTRRFCRVGGMLDPRRGRGMFSTFHAHYPMLRWPLDHIFVTEHFTLMDMQRLAEIGSDHFPILASFCYCPAEQGEQETPQASEEEREEAEETIREGQTEKQQR
ncbi:endonuclease/exonuclease/phosphatase family protein [Vreelandella malpeensis]|uniref:Endonuclease/exonuclease/phosphatase family protein n=1 Tax=Vreelandella malpeensis TaxID=1172368 RepID=A0ABS8DVX8_9GAMM|nr:endonuclease/exonuclease/phosphatase family protein [Halomonas malpeensis]MCB8890354.1 endonuclease/exonuclease/phosphatase family protein [Halomonas malpeensis]